MMRRTKITAEDGTVLRAYLHSPADEPRPGIVMCPGFGGVKPHIDTYAALFAEAGFAVLNYDNRGFGTSEGEPRQELNVFKQLTDMRDAITFAESQPEFDATRGFGVWGSSFSGGLAIVMTTHHPDHAQQIGSTVLALREGKVVANGPASLLLDERFLTDLYRTPIRVLRGPEGLAACLPCINSSPNGDF